MKGKSSHGAVSSAYVVIVTYELTPGARESFIALALAFATRVVAEHPGCRAYRVVDVSDRCVVFVEEYDSREAHASHLESPDLTKFRRDRSVLVKRHRTLSGWSRT